MLLEIAIGLEIIEDGGHKLGPIGAATDLPTITRKIMKLFTMNRNVPCKSCFFSFNNEHPEHLPFVYLRTESCIYGMITEGRWLAREPSYQFLSCSLAFGGWRIIKGIIHTMLLLIQRSYKDHNEHLRYHYSDKHAQRIDGSVRDTCRITFACVVGIAQRHRVRH